MKSPCEANSPRTTWIPKVSAKRIHHEKRCAKVPAKRIHHEKRGAKVPAQRTHHEKRGAQVPANRKWCGEKSWRNRGEIGGAKESVHRNRCKGTLRRDRRRPRGGLVPVGDRRDDHHPSWPPKAGKQSKKMILSLPIPTEDAWRTRTIRTGTPSIRAHG